MPTAHDLLATWIELKTLERNTATWSEEGFTNNPPRLVRYRRLMALFRAFGMTCDPLSFEHGEFIDEEHAEHGQLLKRVASRLNAPEERVGRFGSLHELKQTFEILLEYRTNVEHGLYHGIMEGSGLPIYAARRVDKINDDVRQLMAPIDEILEILIDPAGQSFTRDQLAREFGYPTENLSDIDAEWI